MRSFRYVNVLDDMNQEGYKVKGLRRLIVIIESMIYVLLKFGISVKVGDYRLGLSNDDFAVEVEKKLTKEWFQYVSIRDFKFSVYGKAPFYAFRSYKSDSKAARRDKTKRRDSEDYYKAILLDEYLAYMEQKMRVYSLKGYVSKDKGAFKVKGVQYKQ